MAGWTNYLGIEGRVILGLLALSFTLQTSPAWAEQSSVKATFNVTLSGVSIGRGNLSATLTPESYSIGVAAKVTGIARLVSSGEGAAQVRGRYNARRVEPASYSINNTVDALKNSVSLEMHDNAVTSESVMPPTPVSPNRVPLTSASRRGIIDPLSAFLALSEEKDMLSPSNCERTLKIYDGRQRYDIAMAYARTETTRSGGDLAGPSLVCKAAWRPIAGHRTNNIETSHMEENRDVEATLTPIPGTRFLLITRIAIGTSVGKLMIHAQNVSVTPNQQASLQ
jgi:hypothetical protein